MVGNSSYSLPPWLLLLTLTIGLLISHLLLVPFNSQSLIPKNIIHVALNMTFEPEDTDPFQEEKMGEPFNVYSHNQTGPSIQMSIDTQPTPHKTYSQTTLAA